MKSIFHPHSSSRPKRRRGFSFLEILFSVIVLGIGFIMVAAMFPAAIKQTQANVEDQAYTSISRFGVRTMSKIAQQVDINATNAVDKNRSFLDKAMRAGPSVDPDASVQRGYPRVYSFHDARFASLPQPGYDPDLLWKLTAGNLIVPSDPRYAWVGMFSRDQDPQYKDPKDPARHFLPSATVYLIPVRCRTKPVYSADYTDPNCDLNMVAGASSNLEPMLVQTSIDFTISPPQLKVIGLYSRQGSTNSVPNVLLTPDNNPFTDGAWVVVSDDKSFMTNAAKPANLNGSVFRLAGQSAGGTGGDRWDLAADPQSSPFPGDPTSPLPKKQYQQVNVFVVGVSVDPTAAKSASTCPNRTGALQDLGIQTTVVSFPTN